VATLAHPDCRSQTAVDQGRPRKYVGRRKLKTDDETGGDCKNRKPGVDDEDDVDDAEDNDGNDHTDTKLTGYCVFICFICQFYHRGQCS